MVLMTCIETTGHAFRPMKSILYVLPYIEV